MSYADVERLWECFDALPFECSMDSVRPIVMDEADHLFLPSPGDFIPFTGAATDDVLLFLCSDADGILGLVRAPAERIDARMREDLEALHGRVFANAADLSKQQWDAAIRIMAALALEMRDVQHLAAWAQDEGSNLTEKDLEPLWNLWQGCDVQRWEQLQTRPRFVCALRRAM